MIGIGIVGCGTIAKYRHVPEFFTNSDSRIMGYYNPTYEKSKILASQYGGNAYITYEEMLKDAAIDAVCICSPNKYHLICEWKKLIHFYFLKTYQHLLYHYLHLSS